MKLKRTLSLVAASLALSALAIGGVASCKQGEGQRCQTQADCEEGLQCNEGEGVCRERPMGAIDALPPEFDPLIDAPIDAPIDSSIDGM
jgi:hypothetical protein